MSSQAYKIVLILTDKTLPTMFHDLAALLEGKPTQLLTDMKLQPFTKLKIEAKQEGGSVEVKIKVANKQASPGEKTPKKKGSEYSALKKKLKSTWGRIMRDVHAGVTPQAKDVEIFLLQSEAMISFLGDGDVLYKPYQEALESFKLVYASKDRKGMIQACDELERIKNACHDEFK